ncbi:MAG: TonB-dependent receptor [Pseudomonadota bacterium]
MHRTPPSSTCFRKTALAAGLAVVGSHSLAQGLQLEEVIVTAQKREANVQDVAATVNVVSGQDIERFAAFDFRDIELQTAGLSLTSPNSRNNIISLRGVSVDPEAGTAAAVDVYWNDAIVRPDVAFSQLYDLERIEILRGPQGTLQGRTSPAGAINIITQRADVEQSSGYAQLSADDNDGLNTQVAYGGPIIKDVLAARVAAVYDTNAAANVTNLTTGFDDQEHETSSARFSTTWNVNENMTAQLIYQYLDQDQDDPKAMQGTDLLGVRPTLAADDRKALGKTNDNTTFEANIANLILDWQLLGLEWTGIIGYQDSDKKSQTENDRADSLALVDIPAPTFQTADTEVESWTYELRAASNGNDFWDYMVGLYYQDQNTDTAFNANSVVQVSDGGIGFMTNGTLPVNRNNFAVFTFNSFYLTEDLQLDVGLRWTDYDSFTRSDVFYGGLTFLAPPFIPIEDLVNEGFESRFPIIAIDDPHGSEDAVTGSVALRWDVTDDTNVYVSYSRGYRPGGISIVPSPSIQFLPGGELNYNEEESDAFEVGYKSRLLNDRAQVNAALFYQKFDGYQGFVRGVQVLNNEGVPEDLPGGLVFNGDANIWGVEVEGRVLLTETWDFGGALAYTKAEWDGAEEPCNEREPGESLGFCDIDGEQLANEPEWSLSLNSEYYFPLDSTELYVRGLYKYTDDRPNSDASAGLFNVREDFESYQILDLFAGWRASDVKWDVTLWVKNVFDEDEIVFQQGPDQYDLEISDGSYTQTNILRERTYGATARYNF